MHDNKRSFSEITEVYFFYGLLGSRPKPLSP